VPRVRDAEGAARPVMPERLMAPVPGPVVVLLEHDAEAVGNPQHEINPGGLDLGDPRDRIVGEQPGEPVDLVDCFRRAEDMPPIARAAVAKGAKVLWMQIGIRSDEAARIALAGGLEVVMNRCVKIEHARIMGGLHWSGVNTGVISARRPA